MKSDVHGLAEAETDGRTPAPRLPLPLLAGDLNREEDSVPEAISATALVEEAMAGLGPNLPPLGQDQLPALILLSSAKALDMERGKMASI